MAPDEAGEKAYALLFEAMRESGYLGIAKIAMHNREHIVLLRPAAQAKEFASSSARKMSIAMRLAHRPGSLLASLEPFARHGVNLLKIESRPIHGRPWEYQFFLDLEAQELTHLEAALKEVRKVTSQLRVLGLYPAARKVGASV